MLLLLRWGKYSKLVNAFTIMRKKKVESCGGGGGDGGEVKLGRMVKSESARDVPDHLVY